MNRKTRLNLDLDLSTKERLARLKEATEASSITEVIRRALQLYETAITHREQGAQLLLRQDDEDREIILL